MRTLQRTGRIVPLVLGLLMAAGQAGSAWGQAQAPDWFASLQAVAPADIPAPGHGNFYFAKNHNLIQRPGAGFLAGFGPPFPGVPPYDAGLSVYRVPGTDDYIIDDLDQPDAPAMAFAGAPLRAGGLAMNDAGQFAPMDDLSSSTNLWLEVTNVSAGLVYLGLNNATNQVYEIITKTDLSQTNWTIEQAVWPGTNQVSMPFLLAQNGRTNLFVWAMDWTGITENGNTVPDWWLWENFGIVALSDTNLDAQGNTLLFDYQNGLDPNVIAFTVAITNDYVRTSQTTVTLNLSQGQPFYQAVLVDQANFTNASWTLYNSSNLTVTLGSPGWHDVWVGLTGHAPNPQQVWQHARINYNPFAPTLVVTNPAPGSTNSVPMIQLQGYSLTPLSSLTYDLTNAAGQLTGQPGFVTTQVFDTNSWAFTTNFFQCYDIVLTNGLNTVVLHGNDLAGNSAAVSYSFIVVPGTNVPVVTQRFPADGQAICADTFTMDGWLDSATTGLAVTVVDADGNTNVFNGLVERSGRYWVEGIPLAAGTNQLTLTATDAWGNTTTSTNSVVQSDMQVTDFSVDMNGLFQATTSVFGTASGNVVSVSVNGAHTTLEGDPFFTTNNVPVNDLGDGTVCFIVVTHDANGNAASTSINIEKPDKLYLQSYQWNWTDAWHNRSDSYSWLGVHYAGNDTVSQSQAKLAWSNTLPGSESAQITNTSVGFYETNGPNTNTDGDVVSWTSPPTTNTAMTGLVPNATQVGTGFGASPMTRLPYIAWESCDLTYFTNTTSIVSFGGEAFSISETDEQYHRTAQTVLKYYTGGKAVPGVMNLFEFHASAVHLNDPFAQPPYIDPNTGEYNTSVTPIPGLMLSPVGRTASGTTFYTALPNNETYDVAVRAPGDDHYTYTVDAPIKHVLTLTANNTDITEHEPKFCVGQQVVLSAGWSPAIPDGTQATYRWVPVRDFINVITPQAETTGWPWYRLDPSLMVNQTVPVWFYEAGRGAIYLPTTCVFTNGQTVSFQGKGEVSVYTPQVTRFVPDPPFTPMIFGGWLELGDDGTTQGIMAFSAILKSTTNFPGLANWIQLVNRRSTVSGQNTGGWYWLDNDRFYNTVGGVVGAPPLHTPINPLHDVTLTDSPGISSSASASCTDGFETYLIFRPDPQPTSVWVAIGVVNWGWSASETGGILTNPSVTLPTYTAANGFPFWPYILTNKH